MATMTLTLTGTDQDGTWSANAAYADPWAGCASGDPNEPIWLLTFPASLPASASISGAYFQTRPNSDFGLAGQVYTLRLVNGDPAVIKDYIYSNTSLNPRGGGFLGWAYTEGNAHTGGFVSSQWHFGEGQWSAKNLVNSLNAILGTYGDIASGDKLAVILGTVSGASGTEEGYFVPEGEANEASLIITYTTGAALTQEGYRWRLDDGDQANATWAVAQDVNITAPANDIRRLRILIDSTGDANAAQFQVEYKEANEANWTKLS